MGKTIVKGFKLQNILQQSRRVEKRLKESHI